ncbi:unnamed protein product [Arctia plantaginis]|uniref:Uncharacterized protein n=1 Tax=Arctia plantaginis TaxID=874455 RepID=A0A8S1AZX4_ARCPL|nr:unnamed protein product [Arctia plantaginis]CAB3251340.1 unnamed protein product [Arctia plantaginis]
MVDTVEPQPQTGGGEGTAAETKASVDAQDVKQVETPEAQTENKPEEPKQEAKVDEISENKPVDDPVKEIPVEATPSNGAVAVETSEENKGNSDWQQREQALLQKIEELETFKNARSEDGLKLELKVREEEIDLLKARVRNLETELQAALSKPTGKNHEMIENIKQQHEELLSKARGMIFDKTKMVKNQELQIEALTTQVQSLKDINLITKDLLEIRNSEVKAMEDRLQAMEARFKAEKDRYGLVLERANTSTTLNQDLKKEYETQLAIFKELRQKYEQRVQALVAENNRLKETAQGGTST